MSWEYGYIKLYKSNTFHENAMGIWLQNSFILPFAQKFQAPRHHSTDRGRIVESTQISPWLTHLLYGYIWVNYNDLTVTSLESWFIREIIPKWPNYSGWWNILIYPRYMDISAGTAGCWIFYLKTQTSSCSVSVLVPLFLGLKWPHSEWWLYWLSTQFFASVLLRQCHFYLRTFAIFFAVFWSFVAWLCILLVNVRYINTLSLSMYICMYICICI